MSLARFSSVRLGRLASTFIISSLGMKTFTAISLKLKA
ncbi:hypothetical protein BIW11_03944 [Tropilaelaps mercedesae]|uniref:Uncharacterized protein n=1 Tax=Tropilaelaps mercedesae TaxID=418985 RepID=A0A1V9XDU7_9ACAR|nr:hypothetical protein BIW11_03944 [Tropilaelaps mercedesae]